MRDKLEAARKQSGESSQGAQSMTTTRAALAASTIRRPRKAIDELLLSIADDDFVIGFSDSEWTGIAPLLEEDVAISSLAQDELGHAAALYALLAEVRADGRDSDASPTTASPASTATPGCSTTAEATGR